MPQTAFISGPLDATPTYFHTHYIPLLQPSILSGANFILGPAPGIDTLALEYLLSSSIDPSRITIYMTTSEYANAAWRGRYESLGVGVREAGITTSERDAVMTEESDYDVLRYRTEREARELYGDAWWPRVSATEANERRRAGIRSRAYGIGRGVGMEGDGEERKMGWIQRLMGKLRGGK